MVPQALVTPNVRDAHVSIPETIKKVHDMMLGHIRLKKPEIMEVIATL